MATYDLGKVVGDAGEKGDDGSTVWNTSTAPTYANSKYTFTISNLSGKTGLQIAVNDIIFYSTYYYIVSTVNTTTVDCSTRVSIKGSDATVTIATSFGSTPSDSKVPSEKLTKNSLDAKADASSLATVATTGDYDDLTDKPTLPSASTTTPSADTSSGSYGSGTSYARSNHTHPKSSLYAEATHSHTKSQITDFPTSMTPTSHTHGQITNAGAITSTAVTVASGDNIVITDASDSSKVKRVTNLLADHIKDSSAYSNLETSANATQATINAAINTKLGNVVDILMGTGGS